MGAGKKFQVSGFKFRGSKTKVSKFRVSKSKVSKFQVSKFRNSKTKVSKVRVSRSKVSKFQVSKFRNSKTKLSKFPVSKFRVSKARVSKFSGFQNFDNKSRDVQIAHCKERGEWAELCFMERAARHGLRVSKPHGDSAPYDVVVEWDGRFRRVQVKSTIYRRRGESYSLNVMGPGRKAYRRGVVDFVAVYLIPIDRWYIIPYEALGEKKCSVHFKPGGIRQKYEEYREGWERLKDRSQ
jgi:hypothetical protein